MESNLRSAFATAQTRMNGLESFASSNDTAYQDNLRAVIDGLDQCRQIATHTSLFSTNETLEDVASVDLQYFLIDYRLGDLTLKLVDSDRRDVLRNAQEAFDRFLHLLDTYRLLSKNDLQLYERFTGNRDAFTLVESKDAATRRDFKIQRFREEKELKAKLEYLSRHPEIGERDEAELRDAQLAHINLSTHQSFRALDLIAQELSILSMRPPTPPSQAGQQESDQREERRGLQAEYSERLDPSLASLYRSGKAGPILNKDGRPLQPFTLLDSRDRLRNGVFRPDHALPTMTIDEYLEEERRRGGIIDGGGEQDSRPKLVDEDDIALADMETMKAREWDEFVEANPKGSGNTINRG